MADNLEIINCPACGKEMAKVYMTSQGVNLDVCINGCGGIFFDNREFAKFDEKHEDMSILEEAYKGKTFYKTDESEKRICPVCGQVMVKNHASAKHEIEIDECYACGGKFLDYGELEKVRSEYETEADRAQDALKELTKLAGPEIMIQQEKYNNMINQNMQMQKHWFKRAFLTPSQIKVIESFSKKQNS